jgi:hypothetical protein
VGIAALHQLLNFTVPQLLQENLYFKFLETNHESNLLYFLDDLVEAIRQEQLATKEYTVLVELAVSITASLIITFVFVSGFAPLLYKYSLLKWEVFHLFANIDAESIRFMFTQCTTTLIDLVGVAEVKKKFEQLGLHKRKKTTIVELDTSGSQLNLEREMKDFASKLSESKFAETKFKFVQVLKLSIIRPWLLIATVSVCYFVGIHLWWIKEETKFFSDIDERIRVSNLRRVYARDIIVEFLKWEYEPSSIRLPFIEAKEQELWDLSVAFSYGNASYGIYPDTQTLDKSNHLVDGNLCPLIPTNSVSLAFSSNTCEQFQQGVLTRGAHALILTFVAKSTSLRNKYLSRMNTSDFDAAEFQSHLNVLKEIEQVWIPLMVAASDKYLIASIQAEFEGTKMTRLIIMVCYMLTLFLVFLYWYSPAIGRMDRELKETRLGLMIIPDRLLQESSVVKNLLRKIALKVFDRK